jgi:hypothetical protein
VLEDYSMTNLTRASVFISKINLPIHHFKAKQKTTPAKAIYEINPVIAVAAGVGRHTIANFLDSTHLKAQI